MSNISQLVPMSKHSALPERNFIGSRKVHQYRKRNADKTVAQADIRKHEDSYEQSIEMLCRSKEQLLQVLKGLVLTDLRRLARQELGQAPCQEPLSVLYARLEEHYENLLLRQTHQGGERRLTVGKLSIVCRFLGKAAEADHLEEYCISKGYSTLGTAGFWSLIGY